MKYEYEKRRRSWIKRIITTEIAIPLKRGKRGKIKDKSLGGNSISFRSGRGGASRFNVKKLIPSRKQH